MSSNRPLKMAALAAALLAGPAVSRGAETATPARAAFDQLKSLAGEWQGHVTTADGPAATVVYGLTGNGSAVTERLFPGTAHEMLSVYYMDGSDLVLTHYCAMGNQPRMKLVKSSTNPTTLVFDLAGGTNLDAAKDTHMHGGVVRILDAARLEADWSVFTAGKPSGNNRFFLARK